LQPSHSFFTELRTFIPLTCSAIPFCTSLDPTNSIGLRAVMPICVVKAEKHLGAVVVEGRKEGNRTRAVRRRVVDGIMTLFILRSVYKRAELDVLW
jgi:hypothetical protein